MTSKAQKNAGYQLPDAITGHELECVQLYIPKNAEYKAAFLGALTELTKWWTWEKTDSGTDTRATQAAQYWRQLLFNHLEMDAPCSEIPESGCAQYPLSSGFISWYPRSPYTQGGDVPTGWTGAPFSFVGAGDILLGYIDGDVIVTGFPQPDSGDFTLPSITFNVTGVGVIELHLLTVPNGGMAVVTVDGDLLNSKTFDLNADLVSFPQESNALELVYEVSLDVSGEHSVEVRFAPVLDDALIPVRYGGGIRSVVLCGFDEMTLDVRQKPDNCNILQKTVDGIAWVDFADITDCIRTSVNVYAPKIWRVFEGDVQYSYDNDTFVTYTDADGPDLGLPDADTGIPSGDDAQCIRAKNSAAWFLSTMTDLANSFALGASVTALIGAVVSAIATLGASSLAVPAAATGVVAAITGVGASFTASLFTADIMRQLVCDLYEAFEESGALTADGYETFLETVDSRFGVAWDIIYYFYGALGLIGMFSTGLPASGGVTTCSESPCNDNQIREFDFLLGPDSWDGCMREFQEVNGTPTQGQSFVNANSRWQGRLGWCDRTVKALNSSAYFPHSRIKLYANHALHITKFEIDMKWKNSIGLAGFSRPFQIIVWNTAASQLYIGQFDFANAYAAGEFTLVFNTPVTWNIPEGAEIQFRAAHYVQDSTSQSGPFDGYANIKKIRFYGTE